MHTEYRWYALYVATRKEKLVASSLTEKGFECFLPVCNTRRIWSDRIKVVPVPVFPGYVFSRFDARFRLPLLTMPGVGGIVGNGKIPASIPDRELDAIRLALQNGFAIEPCDRLERGDLVRVTRGALAGVEAEFIRYRGTDRIILSVSLIQRSVAVDIDRLCVEPITKRAE
jgi:transcription antitermination factor NusG